MKFGGQISKQSRVIIVWYSVIIGCCFGLCYLLAGPYDLINRCGGGLQFFEPAPCEKGVAPFVVRMNGETLDARVGSLLPPLSYTTGVGWHLLGTDVLGRDVFAGILYGGQRSLLIGFLAGGLAMLLGWFLGIMSVYVRWHRSRIPYFSMGAAALTVMAVVTQVYLLFFFALGVVVFKVLIGRKQKFQRSRTASWWWGRWIEWYQALPDLLLLLVLSAAIGRLEMAGLIMIIIAVVWPSMAMVARRVASEVSRQPYFAQAIRNKISGKNLLIHYLWSNTKSSFWAMFPLVVARVILLESTISFLGMGLPPDVVTIGAMISAARFHLSSWWLIVFSCLFIFVLVYPLMLMGMKLQKREAMAG